METNSDPGASNETPAREREPAATRLNRLSLPYIARFSIGTTAAFLSGMCLGLAYGSKTAGLRFRAENAHRFPSSSTGWYFYHKTKNYHIMFGGIKEGLKLGSKLAIWTSGFFIIEEVVDKLRGEPDFRSTLIAGLTIAGGFSSWNKLPLSTTARIVTIGFYSSLTAGLLQDALNIAKGQRVGYVDFLVGRYRHRNGTENRID